MGGELGRLAVVVSGVHLAAPAFRDVTGKHRVGGGGFPPGMPALGMPAGETPLVLALAQGQVLLNLMPEPGQTAAFRARLP